LRPDFSHKSDAISRQPLLSRTILFHLHSPARRAIFQAMSNKELVADLIGRLPDDASLLDIAREIEFIAGVREGFAQLDRGEGRPLEDVAKELPSWISK
jgi:predicted transcriptional regulator